MLAAKKEQVLALVTIGICGLWYSGWTSTSGPGRQFMPAAEELEVATVVPTSLIEGEAPASGRVDLFTEPRETQPLPPRELAFPPSAPRTVVALPPGIGPDYRHLVLLATDGSQLEGVSVTPAEEGGEEGSTESQPVIEEPLDYLGKIAQAQKTYDSVYQIGQPTPFVGLVEVVGVDKFDAEKMTDFSQHTVRLRQYKVDTGKFGSTPLVWKPDELNKVDRIRLADNLPNEIERRRRAVADNQPAEREKFIEWLLEQAHDEVWVYDVALEQAGVLAQEVAGNLPGLRWQLRVVRAKGDLAAEFALLDGIEGRHRESALRYEGLGRIAARLGLWQDAERDLRRAVERSPLDAGPHAAMAEFLLGRGRTREAVLAAKAAERAFGSLRSDVERARAVSVIIACYLADGDVEAARVVRSNVSAEVASPALEGAIAYAAGDVDGALAAYRRVSSSGGVVGASRGEARLGEAACLVRLGSWQAAYDVLTGLYEERPLLRHAAAAGLALVYQRLGQFEPSLTWVDRALEADPTYAYAHYLRGRTLRLAGQYADAEEALKAALRLHDDFVHAIAELATLYAERAEGALGVDHDRLLEDAWRYADRAVALSPVESVELFELQGRRHFAVGDRRSATAAFRRAQDVAQAAEARLFARGALAVVDYSRGRVDDAVDALRSLADDLGKEDPMRVWAEGTIDDIDLHAQKELLADRFERSELGSIWPCNRDGRLAAAIVDGRLVFRERFSKTGEVSVERVGAVQSGKNFLAVGVTMQLGARHTSDGFAGLRITTQQGSRGRSESRVEVGVSDGQPEIVLVDGREDPIKQRLEVVGFEPDGEQELELRVLSTGRAQSNLLLLQVSWNGQVVYGRELKSLTGATATELKTVLFVQARNGAQADVAFDDYRLERKKER